MGLSFEEVTSNYHNKNQAVIDLITYCQRHGRFNHLLDAIGKARPNVIMELNKIRTAVNLQPMEQPEEETPAETAVNAPNLVQEMRKLALAMLSLCEEMEGSNG
jgi:hypothetical protein